MAPELGLVPGFALDLRLQKDDGEPWDLSLDENIQAATTLVKDQTPVLLLGCPPCGSFSRLNENLNFPKMPVGQVDLVKADGMRHLSTCCELYKLHAANGRYFLHEHPSTASSWTVDCIKEIERLPGTMKVSSCMCAFDMWMEDNQGAGLVHGATTYLTNSPYIAKKLERRCSNLDPSCKDKHRHVHLMCGRPRLKQTYPPKLVRAMLEGLMEQMHQDGMVDIAALEAGAVTEEVPIHLESQEEVEEYEHYYDDVHGGLLDPKMVRVCRAEEIAWMREHGTYTKVPRSHAEGHKLVKVLWVDTNKGDAEKTRRSGGCEGMAAQLFAATPPLEGFRCLLSMAMGREYSRNGLPLKLGFIDIKKAHLFGRIRRKSLSNFQMRTILRAWSESCTTAFTALETRRPTSKPLTRSSWSRVGTCRA
eukprot:1368359-Amphidinium_carterae.1